MIKNYEKNIKIFKALGEINRVKIVDMLSTGEKMCLYNLRKFSFYPTNIITSYEGFDGLWSSEM